MTRALCLALALLLVGGCNRQASGPTRGGVRLMLLQSRAFASGGILPSRYGGEGPSPPLNWNGVPSDPQNGAKSLALVCRDPDAPGGVWVHWVVWNLPPGMTSLNENVPRRPILNNDARQGQNRWKQLGWRGPAPPKGPAHRYFFDIYALDTTLDLPPTTTRDQLLAAMQNHILATGQLMARYGGNL